MSDLLIRYDVTDFIFDDLRDSVARHDAVNQRVIPRTTVIETARDRFTKESEKASREKQIVRTDYTDRPNSFNEAATQVQDRDIHVGADAPVVAGVKTSTTELYYAQHQSDQQQHRHSPFHFEPSPRQGQPPGGHGHK